MKTHRGYLHFSRAAAHERVGHFFSEPLAERI